MSRPKKSGLGLPIHRNEYMSPAVLEGNWVENRAAYEKRPDPKFSGLSTTRATFQPLPAGSGPASAAAPPEALPAALLFSTSDDADARQFGSVTHLSFRPPHAPPVSAKDAADCTRVLNESEVLVGRQTRVEQKRAQWARERALVIPSESVRNADLAASVSSLESSLCNSAGPGTVSFMALGQREVIVPLDGGAYGPLPQASTLYETTSNATFRR